MPIVRWENEPSYVVSELLLELIRVYHLQAVFDVLSVEDSDSTTFGLHPPDLVGASLSQHGLGVASSTGMQSPPVPHVFVYPDPPLKLDELRRCFKRLCQTGDS